MHSIRNDIGKPGANSTRATDNNVLLADRIVTASMRFTLHQPDPKELVFPIRLRSRSP